MNFAVQNANISFSCFMSMSVWLFCQTKFSSLDIFEQDIICIIQCLCSEISHVFGLLTGFIFPLFLISQLLLLFFSTKGWIQSGYCCYCCYCYYSCFCYFCCYCYCFCYCFFCCYRCSDFSTSHNCSFRSFP